MLNLVKIVLPLLLCSTTMLFSHGMLSTWLHPAGLEFGFEPFALSLIAGSYGLGVLLGTPLVPIIVRKSGHVRALALFISVASTVALLHFLIPQPVFWVVLRCVIGLCMAGIYVAVESWLNSLSRRKTRGGLLSVYLVLQFFALMGGNVILGAIAQLDVFIPFLIISVISSVAVIPILLSNLKTPRMQVNAIMAPTTLYRISPLSLIGTLLGGMLCMSILTTSPIYALLLGYEIQRVTTFMALFMGGSLVGQWIIGRASDFCDRRITILAANVITGLTLLVLLIFSQNPTVFLISAALLGTGAGPIYSLMAAHLSDQLRRDQLVSGGAALFMIWGGGGTLIAPVIGAALNAFGAQSFPLILLSLCIAFSVYVAYRMSRRKVARNRSFIATCNFSGSNQTSFGGPMYASYEDYTEDRETTETGIEEELSEEERENEHEVLLR